MSTGTKRTLTTTITNAALFAILLLGTVVAAVTGRWLETVLLGVLALVVLAVAVHGKHLRSGGVARVNAMDYRDEADRRTAQAGLAAVGMTSLVLSGIGFVTVTLFFDTLAWSQPLQLLATGQIILLCLVWATANSIATRRR